MWVYLIWILFNSVEFYFYSTKSRNFILYGKDPNTGKTDKTATIL